MKTPRLSRKPLDSHSKTLRFSLNSSSNHTQGAPKPTQCDRNTQALINFARNKAIRSGNPDDVHAHSPWNAHRQIEYNLMKKKNCTSAGTLKVTNSVLPQSNHVVMIAAAIMTTHVSSTRGRLLCGEQQAPANVFRNTRACLNGCAGHPLCNTPNAQDTQCAEHHAGSIYITYENTNVPMLCSVIVYLFYILHQISIAIHKKICVVPHQKLNDCIHPKSCSVIHRKSIMFFHPRFGVVIF